MSWLATSLLLLISCQQTQIATRKPVTISIAGATAIYPTLVDLTTEFSRQQPHVLFDISSGNSTLGEERVHLAQVDLAASTLISPTVPSERLTVPQIKPLRRVPIGLDGLVLITHQSNPIDNLTLLQLRELYSGRVWNWQELGGNDEAVHLITREDGSGSRTLFDERIMGIEPLALTAVVVPSNADVIDEVLRYEGAIGYVSRAFVIDLLQPKTAPSPSTLTATAPPPTVHLIKIEDQLPTAATLATQSYFLIQPLYLVTSSQPRAVVRQFVDFTLSPAGQAIVARYHHPIR
jgi:phosphate transport system substrate-binding protein